jgi:hypothetical protein
MDDSLESAWIDYDLFCKFSKKYTFHFIDQVLATYRLHTQAQTWRWTESQRLEDCIRLSRRHWGSPLTLMYWQLTFSLAKYRFNRVGRGREWFRQAQNAWHHRQMLRAIPYAIGGGVLAPEVAFYVGIYPPVRDRAKGLLKQALSRLVERQGIYPQTAVYLEHTEPWADGWIGPRLIVGAEATAGARVVVVQGWGELGYMSKPLVLTVRVDGEIVGQQGVERGGDFVLQFPLSYPLTSGAHRIEVEASSWFVPHRFTRNGDFRPLAWRMTGVGLA